MKLKYFNFVRYLIMFLIPLICLFFGKKAIEKNCALEEKSKIAEITGGIVLVCIELIILLFPYERIFRFESLEDIFNFYCEDGEIIKKYEYDDYAYIFYYQDYAYSSEVFQKDEDGWYWENWLGKTNEGWCGKYLVTIDTRSDKYNAVDVIKWNSTGIEKNVEDNIGSSFDFIENDGDSIYVAITEKDIPDDYEISINGKTCKVFEN